MASVYVRMLGVGVKGHRGTHQSKRPGFKLPTTQAFCVVPQSQPGLSLTVFGTKPLSTIPFELPGMPNALLCLSFPFSRGDEG